MVPILIDLPGNQYIHYQGTSDDDFFAQGILQGSNVKPPILTLGQVASTALHFAANLTAMGEKLGDDGEGEEKTAADVPMGSISRSGKEKKF